MADSKNLLNYKKNVGVLSYAIYVSTTDDRLKAPIPQEDELEAMFRDLVKQHTAMIEEAKKNKPTPQP
ncbi:MAG: hypothetical protein PHP42_08355 [Bacteroidota bacterium]|nr:hypothetical protein [Bacteroidota bacterium]